MEPRGEQVQYGYNGNPRGTPAYFLGWVALKLPSWILMRFWCSFFGGSIIDIDFGWWMDGRG